METDRLIEALVQTKNEAADDVLLEGLRLGSEGEKPALVAALLKRQTLHGLSGLIGQYESLGEGMRQLVLENILQLHGALRECGRSEESALRLAAMKIIALGRQGKLAYILSDNLRSQHAEVSKAAVEALAALSQWISGQTKWLQKGEFSLSDTAGRDEETCRATLNIYQEILAQRPEVEAAVVKAIDLSRGRYGPELLTAALLLCDWPGSKTLAILQTAKHGGQTAMVRRLEQPPAAEHVEAFLLSASHAQLRQQFGTVFAHINDGAVLDGLLRRTHWLKDMQLQVCMHQVTRGAWWGESELLEDAAGRDSGQAARIGDWLVASGAHDVIQDDRMERLKARAENNFAARLRLLRLAASRRRGASIQFLKGFLSDPDERLARMAARELIRRRPPDYEGLLLTRMPTAPLSVRRVIGRSLGQVGFEQFWQRYDQLDLPTRAAAGRAMLKILPDSAGRLKRRLLNGAVDERIKAIQMTHDLGLVSSLRQVLAGLTEHANPTLRSRAVGVLAGIPDGASDVMLDRVLRDTDPRVRANAVAVLEATRSTQFLPILAEKARLGASRERANAIKALYRLQAGPACVALEVMLKDQRPEHRVSALWALRELGCWKLIGEVGRLAKEDTNMRVRRYALGILKGLAASMQRGKEKAG